MSIYTVTLKNGEKFRGDTVEHMPGFIKIIRGKRERRIPMSEVVLVDNKEMREFVLMKSSILYVAIFFVVLILVFEAI